LSDDQIELAAKMWNAGFDTFRIAKEVLGDGNREPIVYRLLWSHIIARAIALRRQ
jgi:hypothetical protein